MDRNRLWVIGSVVVIVMIVVAGWFLGIQPQLAVASAANDSREQVASENAASEAVLAKLKRDYRSIGALRETVATLRASVPATQATSALVTELGSLSRAQHVAVKSITVSDPQAYTPPIAAEAPAPSSAAAATATPAPQANAAPVAPATPTAAPAVTSPLITTDNFIAVPVQLSVTGSYRHVLAFMKGLQGGSRLFLVTTFDSTTSATATHAAHAVDASIGGLVYVLLGADSTATTTAAPRTFAPVGPRKTATPTPTTTATSTPPESPSAASSAPATVTRTPTLTPAAAPEKVTPSVPARTHPARNPTETSTATPAEKPGG